MDTELLKTTGDIELAKDDTGRVRLFVAGIPGREVWTSDSTAAEKKYQGLVTRSTHRYPCCENTK